MPKRILTEEDFNNNPILPELGLKVGDEVEIPEASALTDDEGGEGGNHPNDPSGKP